jgi:Rrf2 family protein
MKISNTCSYVISAMTHIAAKPEGSLTPNTSICEAAKLPERYVLQLLRKLVNAGVLVSVRGVQGGYKLAGPASKITILEIVEAIDGPVEGVKASDFEGLVPASVGVVAAAFKALAADTRKRLSAITLADLRAAKAA